MTRKDGRPANQPRPVSIQRGYVRHALGSALIEMGRTRVVCTASIEPEVPKFLEGTGKGWLTAEYGMLPASTTPRKRRDRGGSVDGRSVEIQRLIGRSLRQVVRLEALAGHTLWVDCDVLDADGGTRTASITGAFVALADAIHNPSAPPGVAQALSGCVAAISVGILGGEVLVDLDYDEDSRAEVDMNLVMTGSGRFVEVQGTGEKATFTAAQLEAMLAVGRLGIQALTLIQQRTLGECFPGIQAATGE